MKRWLILFLGAALAVPLIVQASAANSSEQEVLEFDTMVGVSGPFVGSTHPIRGIVGGGLPWQIASAKGELTSDGSLQVEVRGLVLLDGAPVPPDLRGTNPVSPFQAIVSCVTIVGGERARANVATGPFPASQAGDAETEATVSLPSPCFAPIIFVGAATTWFAATGRS